MPHYQSDHTRSRSAASQSWQKLYRGIRWRTLRANVLRRADFKCQCPHCVSGDPLPATVVDHIKPHHGDKRLFYALNNLQAMNSECHNKWKQSEEAGGHGFMKGTDATGQPLNKEHDWWG